MGARALGERRREHYGEPQGVEAALAQYCRYPQPDRRGRNCGLCQVTPLSFG